MSTLAINVPWFIAAQIWTYDPVTGVVGYTKKWATKDDGTPRAISTKPNKHGYVLLTVPRAAREDVGGSSVSAHRIAFLLAHGWLPEEVDHENNVRSDNRLLNLRAATKRSNNHNRLLDRDNTSGFKGVHRFRGRWMARIRDDNQSIYLGMHDKPEDAAQAYDAAAVSLFGKFARTNKDLGLLNHVKHSQQSEGMAHV
jgi:hypothetical protein